MKAEHKQGRNVGRLAAAVALALVSVEGSSQSMPYQSQRRMDYGSGVGQQPLPAGAYVEPRLDWALQYADNYQLASDGGDSSFGVELSPGFYASYRSERFTGAADYSLIGRWWDLSELDDVTQQLSANGQWIAVPELISVDAQAAYGDTVLDYGNGANYGNLGVFNTGNLVEQASASVSPTLRKRFKDFELLMSYSYGRVWYLDKGKGSDSPTLSFGGTEDSKDQSATVSFGLLPDASKISGRLFYDWQHSDYENSIPYEFERAGFDGAAQLTRTLSFVGDVGKESDLEESTQAGGLDSDFWSAGLKWSPNSRTSAEARAGERYFGTSYSANIHHAARIWEFTATYDESPQVLTRQASLGTFDPGTLPGYDPTMDYSRFTADPYLGKDARLQVSARGHRTTLTLEGFYSDRTFVNDRLGDEEGTGAYLLASRQLATNASLDADVRYTDYLREPSDSVTGVLPGSHDFDTQFTVRFNRDFGANLSGSVEAGYFNRGGTSDYDGWWVGLRGRWIPDFGR